MIAQETPVIANSTICIYGGGMREVSPRNLHAQVIRLYVNDKRGIEEVK